MTFRGIFEFELGYQLRRLSTWFYFAVMVALALAMVRGAFIEDARAEGHVVNAGFVIASITVFGGVIWLLMAAHVAGDAAARDVQSRMHPLIYTTPISKASYLGGRFAAAFTLNAAILLGVPVGILLGLFLPGVEPELLGPFRPMAFLTAYGFIALPFAFATTAIQFSAAVRDRRTIASYVASVVILLVGHLGGGAVGNTVGWDLAKLVDPLGVVGIVRFFEEWSPIEKNTRIFMPDGWQSANRLLLIGIGLVALAFTYIRFRFDHPSEARWRSPFRRRKAASPVPSVAGVSRKALTLPPARRTFGFATHVRQTLAIAWASFRAVVTSRAGVALVAVLAGPFALLGRGLMMVTGAAVVPTTAQVLPLLTTSLSNLRTPWIIIPLLIVYYAGELVWRERDAGMGEIADAAPVSEWVLFAGKLIGLGLVIVVWLSILLAAGIVMQLDGQYHHFEIGLYVRALFGLQLTEYLLFAVLALVIHGTVNQKYVGHLVALAAYGSIVFASQIGINHDLLIYGASPAWLYSDLRGFGASLAPWLWFKFYWLAWALLLAVVAKLLWIRGRDHGVRPRLRLVRGRFTRPTAWVGTAAVVLVVAVGSFVFYNTNVLNAYLTNAGRVERSVEYERRYGRYAALAQPNLTSASLRVEIYPQRREVEIHGTYSLLNRSTMAIEAIHLTTVPGVETGGMTFDRSATRVIADDDLGYRIYALGNALQPGESLQLSFQVRIAPRGFTHDSGDALVVANGTYFTDRDGLPVIGYQRDRAPRVGLPSLDDPEARLRSRDRIAFEAIVGTDEGQTAVTAGALRRTWIEQGRRYFHYATDAPIPTGYTFLSAAYAVHEARWSDVAIRVYYHPAHGANIDRMVGALRDALGYFTEQFGQYPYRHLTVVERGTSGDSLRAEASAMYYGEKYSLFTLLPNGVDTISFAMAHELAHQWWGHGLTPARVEGEALLAESLANYSAMQVLKRTYGPEHLERYLRDVLRVAYDIPRTRAGVPLLRANTAFLGYRKGAHAVYGLSRYIGEEQINTALRRLFERYRSGPLPAPTTRDLYRELQLVTPASLQYLLRDLFETNTYWELDARQATARPTEAGAWQVALDVRARKVVVDEAGNESESPMDDWVEIGIFEDGALEPLYRRRHRITAHEQKITVTVPRQPARAAIDPDNLLIDWDVNDNFARVQVER